MMCFGRISEQEIRDALSNTKDVFCTGITVAEKPEQCVKALKIAVDTLTRVQKDGKRALNKAQNFDLKEEVAGVYRELTQLQDYSGPDKVQKCIKLATKLRYVTNQSVANHLNSTLATQDLLTSRLTCIIIHRWKWTTCQFDQIQSR